MTPTKFCPSCNTTKPLDDFYPSRGRASEVKRQHYCIPCFRILRQPGQKYHRKHCLGCGLNKHHIRFSKSLTDPTVLDNFCLKCTSPE